MCSLILSEIVDNLTNHNTMTRTNFQHLTLENNTGPHNQIVRPRKPQQITLSPDLQSQLPTTQNHHQHTKTMASPLSLPSLQSSIAHKSNFLSPKPNPVSPSSIPRHLKLVHLRTNVKFNISELLGGRGLCNGEKGVEKELKREAEPKPEPGKPAKEPSSAVEIGVDEEGFDKEMFGLTGGFPGGEKGLKKFIEKNPPPPKAASGKATEQNGALVVGSMKKPKAPELPLLLPGMIVIVKNPKNPFYMYCGIVQRITDGKAGVLFEGGNWDRLITFRLEELERREKGPPMVNPKSAILEGLVEQEAS